jgi:hypothetical protein
MLEAAELNLSLKIHFSLINHLAELSAEEIPRGRTLFHAKQNQGTR